MFGVEFVDDNWLVIYYYWHLSWMGEIGVVVLAFDCGKSGCGNL